MLLKDYYTLYTFALGVQLLVSLLGFYLEMQLIQGQWGVYLSVLEMFGVVIQQLTLLLYAWHILLLTQIQGR
ncbi:MAG: hypothetical protein RMZ69_18485 [Nostoc sp. ChiQUE01a]|nr:hypothetical protein [Nostoc sp. ChiQUE01a]